MQRSSRLHWKGNTFIYHLFKAWVLVQPWELNAPPSTLQSRALQTELVLPRFENKTKQKDLQDCQSTESGG